MRKFFLATITMVSMVILFASCAKEYTCSCTFPNNPEDNFDVQLDKMRRNDAIAVCTDYTKFMDSVSNASCGIK